MATQEGQGNVQRVALMLEEAATLLRSGETTTSDRISTPPSNPIQRTLQREQVQCYKRALPLVLYRRLNQNERLRATDSLSRVSRQSSMTASSSKQTKKPRKEAPKKAVEFALLRCFDEEDEPPSSP